MSNRRNYPKTITWEKMVELAEGGDEYFQHLVARQRLACYTSLRDNVGQAIAYFIAENDPDAWVTQGASGEDILLSNKSSPALQCSAKDLFDWLEAQVAHWEKRAKY